MNACDGMGLTQFKSDFTTLPGLPEPAIAWAVAHAMVCGKSAAARRMLMAHMPRRLKVEGSATGEETRAFTRPRSHELMYEGSLWGATVILDNGMVSVDGWANEACMKGFLMRFKAGQWLVTELHDACD